MQNFFPQPIPADLPQDIPNFLPAAMPTLTGGSLVTLSPATISRWLAPAKNRPDAQQKTLESALWLLAPAPPALPSLSPCSPSTFVDIIEKHHDNAALLPFLLDVQRWEWAQLFLQTWADPKETSRT